MKRIALFSVAALLATPVLAQPSEKIYAQQLIDSTLAKHPELITLTMHVTPPKTSQNIVIAASDLKRIGQRADPDDLEVIRTGKPLIEVNDKGNRLEVQLPLMDASRSTVGGLEMAFAYKKGDDKQKTLKEAEKIRDDLRNHIYNDANLVEPAQFDRSIPVNSYAQKLVDDVLERHPEVLIVAIHVTPPNSSDNMIIASNIGRIGKKADEDDMVVLNTGKPNLGLNSHGDRYEAEDFLKDVSGKQVGLVSIVYPYKKGDRMEAMHAKAERIRDELGKKIPSLAALLVPVR